MTKITLYTTAVKGFLGDHTFAGKCSRDVRTHARTNNPLGWAVETAPAKGHTYKAQAGADLADVGAECLGAILRAVLRARA